MLSCFIFIGGGRRLYHLSRRRKYTQNINNITTSKKNIAKLAICVAVVLLQLISVIGEYASPGGEGLFHIIYALHASAAWVCISKVFPLLIFSPTSLLSSLLLSSYPLSSYLLSSHLISCYPLSSYPLSSYPPSSPLPPLHSSVFFPPLPNPYSHTHV